MDRSSNLTCERLNKHFRFLALLLVLLFIVSTVPVHASLIFVGVDTVKRGGIGSSSAVLTIQDRYTEQGCVAWNGSYDVIGSAACPGGLFPAIVGGSEKTGNRQTQTLTLAEAGVRSGASLRVILNVNEPAGTPVTIENLTLTIYNPNGAVLFNSGNLAEAAGGGITLNSSFQGQGSPGFAFKLDETQAAAANPFVCTSASVADCSSYSPNFAANAGNRIGLAAVLTNVQGGIETFSISDLGQ